MKNGLIYISILLLTPYFGVQNLHAQSINTDSLIVALVADTRDQKNPQEIINKAHQALKIAPEYWDYYVVMGQNFERIPVVDSAQFYFKKVIENTDKYPEVYNYLINSEITNQQYEAAFSTIEKAKTTYPEKASYYDEKKLRIYNAQGDEKAEIELLEKLLNSGSEDKFMKDRYILLANKIKNDRIGFQYFNTSFNRDGYGPWNQFVLQYIRSRKWGTLVTNINTMNRKSANEADVNGMQFEASAYIFTTKTNYVFVNSAFSNNKVYPKYRLGGSYYFNLSSKWEMNAGVRFTQTTNENFTSIALGTGVYYKAFWFNLSSFYQIDQDKVNPAFNLTTRYYFGSRFDYLYSILGYGTSPDDDATAGLYENRVSLSSYRMGVGISKTIQTHYIVGCQFLYNNQEYVADKRQNEYELMLSLQYKF
ncbi:YaiO family outer membrane beta-barrel protein [Flavobacterium agrisoli]|uniref:YaiO family outer membrane beta-barrel protein n=1 Tax=Flavobacterium agrisoli TaxID=2793066 RepID=A0A934PML1_9FLAO|nr:YaiO family outer membrane beta-barrel protein [Flavobacterium agrisoli]MBK0370015.1 YaiO family outer membrane beta-barrel protein [Flavobacterium agrisoli]